MTFGLKNLSHTIRLCYFMGSDKQLYIVLSQTGTLFSRLLKLFTGAPYNHASVSLSCDLRPMYSFGRLNPYNAFCGGFVTETIDSGTFKRFYKTDAEIIAVDISAENYKQIAEILENMRLNSRNYRYNFLGVCLAAFHIAYKRKNRYYCSEFVKYVLQKCDVDGADMLLPIVEPIHFLKLPHRVIYCGRLNEYQSIKENIVT